MQANEYEYHLSKIEKFSSWIVYVFAALGIVLGVRGIYHNLVGLEDSLMASILLILASLAFGVWNNRYWSNLPRAISFIAPELKILDSSSRPVFYDLSLATDYFRGLNNRGFVINGKKIFIANHYTNFPKLFEELDLFFKSRNMLG